jgi:hypothetical protein
MIKSVLTEAILAHDFHFSFVEYYKISVWVEYLNPCAEMVSSITIVSDIEKIYDIERSNLSRHIAMLTFNIKQ